MMASARLKIIGRAKQWIGSDFRAGVPEQCMNWVRHVLKEVGHPKADSVTDKPVDGLWTAPGLANSLAGRDMGAILTRITQLDAGDILFWEDTYPGPWPARTITHVGIYVGGLKFVHRPTAARPVELEELRGGWVRQFRCGLRFSPVDLPDPSPCNPGKDPELTVLLPDGTEIPAWPLRGRTYAPVRSLMEGIGYRVDYDPDSKTVRISEEEG